MSRLDVVLFGASGFTGKHAAEQLARLAAERKLSWAVAGRSREKLLQVLKHVSDKTGKDHSSTKVLIADVQNEQSLVDMCEQARVLVNCCGPYILYGEVVVKAAIRGKAHYLDISGEATFIETMQLKYDQAAREAGVYVVSACGFESIPTDLGVIFLQQNFGGVLNSVECYMSCDLCVSSINYGTWHSALYSVCHMSELPALRKIIYPTKLPKFTPKLKSRLPFHKRMNSWCLPSLTTDNSTVYRTQRYFYERDGTRPAQIKSYLTFTSFWNVLAIIITSFFMYILCHLEITRKIILKKSRIFSLGAVTNGPSEDVIESVRFEFRFYGKGWDESVAAFANTDAVPPRKTMVAKVSGTNPGYGATVTALLYSAVAILDEPHNIPPGGGVLTPGVMFAKTNLIKNLQDNNINFEILPSKVHND